MKYETAAVRTDDGLKIGSVTEWFGGLFHTWWTADDFTTRRGITRTREAAVKIVFDHGESYEN